MSQKCSTCGGTGRIGKKKTFVGSSGVPTTVTPISCTTCNGTGRA